MSTEKEANIQVVMRTYGSILKFGTLLVMVLGILFVFITCLNKLIGFRKTSELKLGSLGIVFENESGKIQAFGVVEADQILPQIGIDVKEKASITITANGLVSTGGTIQWPHLNKSPEEEEMIRTEFGITKDSKTQNRSMERIASRIIRDYYNVTMHPNWRLANGRFASGCPDDKKR